MSEMTNVFAKIIITLGVIITIMAACFSFVKYNKKLEYMRKVDADRRSKLTPEQIAKEDYNNMLDRQW